MENMEQRLEKLGQLVERNFEKSGLKRELEDLIAKANAQLQGEPQSREQILEQLRKDFLAPAGRHEAVGWAVEP